MSIKIISFIVELRVLWRHRASFQIRGLGDNYLSFENAFGTFSFETVVA
jgi:hypothetical protein